MIGEVHTFPTMSPHHFAPSFETVLVHCDTRPDNIKQHIIEERLESRNISALIGEQLRESIRASNAE